MSVGELRGTGTYDSAQNRSAVTRRRQEDLGFDAALAVASSRPPERTSNQQTANEKVEGGSVGQEAARSGTGATARSTSARDAQSNPTPEAKSPRDASQRTVAEEMPERESLEPPQAKPPIPMNRPLAEEAERVAMLVRPTATQSNGRPAPSPPAASSPQGTTAAGAAATSTTADLKGPGSSAPTAERNAADLASGSTEGSQRTDRPGNEAQPTSHVIIPFADADGAEGRIRVAVRGDRLRATILSQDPGTIRRLRENRGELHRNLRSRGFTETEVSVRPIGDPARRAGEMLRKPDSEVIDD